MSYYYSYGQMNPDYLCHYGVQGMKWGQHLFGKISGAVSNHKATKAAIKSEKKALLNSYSDNKGPTRHGVMNAANSAARSYYRAQRTNNFGKYKKQTQIQTRKEARLTEEQVKGGRYRVAKARNIRRKVLSTAVGALAAGGVAAASVATGGVAAAAILGVGAGGISGVATNAISGGWYYAGEQRAYGSTRAKYQAKENVNHRSNSSSIADDEDKD